MKDGTIWNARTIIIALLVLNAVALLILQACTGKGLRCVQYQTPRPGKPINYLIAGNVAQPEQAFQFLLGDLEGEIVFCNFSQFGWNARESAEEILLDINRRTGETPKGEKTLARIYAISCGDIVARYLDGLSSIMPSAEIEIVAINPCSNAQVLRPYVKWGLRIVTLPFKLICHAAGFLSCIPCIPGTGSLHSPMLVANQWMEIAWSSAPQATDRTTGVILSRNDGFLVNAKICEYFGNVRKIEIVAKHGKTKEYATEYAKACQLAIEASSPRQTVERLE